MGGRYGVGLTLIQYSNQMEVLLCDTTTYSYGHAGEEKEGDPGSHDVELISDSLLQPYIWLPFDTQLHETTVLESIIVHNMHIICLINITEYKFDQYG